MYQYQYIITTAKKITDLKKYTQSIEACAQAFNEASSYAKNYKHIQLPITFHDEYMEFVLESENDLGDVPSLRPLWLFSKLLLDVDGFNTYCVNKRFLKPITMKRIGIDDVKLEMDDKEIVKCIIDIYMQDGSQSAYMKKLQKDVKLQIAEIMKTYKEKCE